MNRNTPCCSSSQELPEPADARNVNSSKNLYCCKYTCTCGFFKLNFTAEKLPERPATKQPPVAPKRKDELPPQSPTGDQQNEINYANVYQALWNCDASDKDELGFRRGDLIYIYEKPHCDWWIGSLFKPQGYSVGLVPKQYVMEAYELSA